MYQVPQAYHDAMQSSVRRVLGKVVIDYTDPQIDQSITVTQMGSARISWPGQVADGIKQVPYLWAQLDGTWVVGEKRRLMPDTEVLAQRYQVGWVGQYSAGSDGSLGVEYAVPALVVTHTARPVHRLQLVGDPVSGEYATSFTVKLYGATDTLLHTEAVTGNTEVDWSMDLGTVVLDVVKQELYLHAWSEPYKVPRVVEFFSSIQQVYSDGELLSVTLVEERESSLGRLPVGTASANEIHLTISNEDRRFDADNDESPLYRLVKARRRIRAWLGTAIGGVVEWVPLGVFWSTDWDTDNDNLSVVVTGRDRLEALRQTVFASIAPEANVSLYDLAEQVLVDAGLKDTEYEIDEALEDVVVPWVYLPVMSHREALRLIAEAALAVVYTDRDGRIRVEVPTSAVASGTSETAYLHAAYAAEIDPQALYAVGPDDYYKISTPALQSHLANEVAVTPQLHQLEPVQEVYRSEYIEVEHGQQLTVSVRFEKSPVIGAVVSLENTTHIVIVESYTGPDGATVTVENVDPMGMTDSFVVVVHGQPITKRAGAQVVRRDAASALEHGVVRYDYPSNPLVQTTERATEIAQAILAASAEPKRDVVLDWRANPALELGDGIHVLTDAKRNRRSEYTIVQQELEWSGALRGRLTGRRMD